MSKVASLFILCVLCLIALVSAASSPQCAQAPTLIPDTFSISYQPIDEDNGIVYFSYTEPSWENWQMFDIRELASDPFRATFTLNLTDANIKFSIDDCTFRTPQSYSRPYAVVPSFSTTSPELFTLVFTQTGSLFCNAVPSKQDTRGRQQYSVEGSLALRTYRCDATTLLPTSGSDSVSIDAASKVSLPDLYVHRSCSRLTLTYESTSQLSLRQTDGLALDISALPTMQRTDASIAPNTILVSYTATRVPGKQSGGSDVYSNVLSFCTFNGSLSSEFNPIGDANGKGSLFVPGTDPTQVSFNIKNSKIPSYCFNGIKDFDESDIDCGGNGQLNGCPPCVDASQICNGNSDCVSGQCLPHKIAGKRCYAISSANGVVGVGVVILAVFFGVFF